jgi:FkbM family methyltransferase
MKKRIKKYFRRIFPWTLILKAWLNARKDAMLKTRDGYSQTGEDRILIDLFRKNGISKGRYIDVGANHPSKLSNTYRLYREGFTGIVIEPNRSLLRLHRMIRPNDLQLGIGCGEKAAVLSFQHATSHVLSGFQSEGLKASSFRGTELIPVLPLDLITAAIPGEDFAVLSIDVEGFDLQVALGATETLKRTRFVVIEGEESDAAMMKLFEDAGFKLVEKTKHNLIFVNSAFATPKQ